MEKRVIYLIPPDTLLEDIKRVFDGFSINIGEIRVEGTSWQIIGAKDGVLVKAALSFVVKRVSELAVFGEIPISALEVCSEGSVKFNKMLKRRIEIGLLRAAGV